LKLDAALGHGLVAALVGVAVGACAVILLFLAFDDVVFAAMLALVELVGEIAHDGSGERLS
jgi:hypothetical protein